MTERHLLTTLQPEWQAGRRNAARLAKAASDQGEVLNFETSGQFFGELSEKRREIVRAAQGRGELSVRELARLVHRDVKRVHKDIGVLPQLGLLDRSASGRVCCPYASMDISKILRAA